MSSKSSPKLFLDGKPSDRKPFFSIGFLHSSKVNRVICRALTILILPLALYACGDSGSSFKMSEEEEDVLYYTNYARTDPQGFAEEFLAAPYASSSDNGAYEDLMARDPVPALEPSEGLFRAARAHAKDMAENCGLQHDSCDGTTWSDRIRSYYDGGTIGENAAVGFHDAKSVVVGLIIDAGVPSLGHRKNIFNTSFEHIGIGKYGSYWVQDFGAGGEQ